MDGPEYFGFGTCHHYRIGPVEWRSCKVRDGDGFCKKAPSSTSSIILVEQGTLAGSFEKEEETIIKRTLKLSDCSVAEVMTQRMKLVCLDFDAPIDVALEKVRSSMHSYFPVYQGSHDQIVGAVSVKRLFSAASQNHSLDLKAIVQEPLYIPERMAALKLLGKFKTSGKHFAIVVDEYGD